MDQKDSVRGRLGRGAFWLASSRLIVNAIGLLSTVVLARLLTPSDFGLVAIATSALAVITAFTNISLSTALISLPDITAKHIDAAWTLNLMRAVVLAILCAVCAFPMARFYGDDRLVPIFIALGGVVFCSGLSSPKLAILNKRLIFWPDFVQNVSAKVFSTATAIIIGLLLKSYWAIVASAAVLQIIPVVLSYYFAPYRPKLSLAGSRDLLSFSIWLTLSEAINTLNWRSDSLFIGAYLGTKPLGFYTVGSDVAAIATRVTTVPLFQALVPAFSLIQGNPAKLARAYREIQSLTFTLGCPMGLGFALVADRLVPLILGQQWLPTIPIMQAVSVLFAIQTVTTANQPLALAMGRTRVIFWRDVLGFLIRMPLTVGGLFAGGLMGLLVGRVCAGIIHSAISVGVTRQLIGVTVKDQFAGIWRAATSALLMALAVSLAKSILGSSQDHIALALQLVGLIFLGALVYGVSLFTIWHLQGRKAGAERALVNLLSSLRSRK
ncbi:lipopolysaccharide biosynthesis protein [Microvirga sp. 2YAF29]|uniref:lipopolysaccharide biosynthesis protein n=1 Tax=Microvirga sp. 2YAF29 TaxID=3233031 RepID=UPI003F98D943